MSRSILGRLDLLAGLITAGPDIVEHYWAIVIGTIGGVICTVGIKLLEKVRVDDVVGAVPAHLFAGAWGTLAASIGVQLLGVVAIGAFTFGFSWLLWKGLEKTVGAGCRLVSSSSARMPQSSGSRRTRSSCSCQSRTTIPDAAQ